MHKFEFRLETILRYNERQKKTAEMRVQEIQQRIRILESNQQSLNQRILETSQHLKNYQQKGAEPAVWLNAYQMARVLEKDLSIVEKEIQDTQAILMEAMNVLKKWNQATETILSLKQQRWQEYRKLAEKEEQKRVEELVLRQWHEDHKSVGL